MSKHSIKLTLDSEKDVIGVDSFVRIVRHTLIVLKELHAGGADWFVGETSHNSPLGFELFANDPSVVQDIARFIRGIEQLERSGNSRPEGFNDRVLRCTKTIVGALDDSVSSIVYTEPATNRTVRVTQRLAANVDEITSSPHYYAITELEGRLRQITVHGGKSEFCIYEPHNDQPIICAFDSAEAEDIGGRITHRIRVFGKAKYRRNGRPTHIDVRDWKPLPDRVLGAANLRRAEIKFGGGERSEQVVRNLRERGWRKT